MSDICGANSLNWTLVPQVRKKGFIWSFFAASLIYSAFVCAIAIYFIGNLGVYVFPNYVYAIYVLLLICGVYLICNSLFSLARLTNPRVRIRLDCSDCIPGESFALYWALSGKMKKILSFEIALMQINERDELVGENDTYTHVKTQYRKQLFYGEDIQLARRGCLRVSIPEDGPLSHDSGSKRNYWLLTFDGKVAWRPSIQDEYEIEVLPKKS